MRPCTSTFPIDSSRNIRFRCTDASASVQGDVYLAEDTKLERKVAPKDLPPELADNEERRSRFRREAKAIAALNHPNIVTVYSVEEADAVHFITMELVKGKTLTELIPRHGFARVEPFLRHCRAVRGRRRRGPPGGHHAP